MKKYQIIYADPPWRQFRGGAKSVRPLSSGIGLPYESVFTEQVKNHSQKPEIAYRIIERLYPNTNKLELYARTKRSGWDCWGNEVESDIVLVDSK